MPQTEPAIANYDDHTAEEIRQRLHKLSQAELSMLEAHEKQGQARSTVLETIAALRGDEPWSGYDDMEVEEVNEALRQRDGDAAGRVLDYERHHKARTTVIEFAKRRRDGNDGSSGSTPPASGKDEPGSQQSASSSARSKTTSRPGATRSSGSRQTKRSQGGSRPRSQSRSAGRSRTQSGKPSTTPSSQSGGPAIANYDDHTAEEIRQRLRRLSQPDLAELEAYEKQHQGRSTVLETIAALRGDEPWSGYDNMEVEEVNEALKQRDGDAAGRVLDYERQHKGRKTIIEFASVRREASEGSQARPRSQSSKSSSRPKGAASKSSSAASRRGSASRSASRSTGGRAAKAPTGSRAKTTPRPSATRSSGSQQTRSSRGGSQPRSQSRSASRSRTQSREPAATRSRQSESRAREALQAAAAQLKQRATEALRNAEGPTKKLARDTEQAVGSAAQDGRDAVGTAIRDTGQAVAAAANKAKAPALVGAATLATVGGGIALGSKVKRRRRKRMLGVAVPRRPAVGKAAKRVGKAVDSLSSTGQQIGQWSEDLQYLRQRIAGEPLDRVTAGSSPGSELFEGKSGAGRSRN
jgi:hypothetical protein